MMSSWRVWQVSDRNKLVVVLHKLPVIFHAFSQIPCLWRGIVDPQSLPRFWRTVYHPLTRLSRSSSSLRLVCVTFILKIFIGLYWMYCNHTTLHWFVCWLQAGFLLEQLKEDESPMGPLLQACLSTLAFLFTTLPAKNPLKRAVARFPYFSCYWKINNSYLKVIDFCVLCLHIYHIGINLFFFISALGSGPDWLQEQMVGCLSENLSLCLSSTNTDQCSHLTNSITSCLDGFKIGMFKWCNFIRLFHNSRHTLPQKFGISKCFFF